MENGYDGKLAEKFSGLGLGSGVSTGDPSFGTNSNSNHNDSSLFQVMKAVEAAEATIKQQVSSSPQLQNPKLLSLFYLFLSLLLLEAVFYVSFPFSALTPIIVCFTGGGK